MLIIVDMQNEYVDMNGKAPIKGAKKLENGILDRIKYYENRGERIYYTINTKVSDRNRDKSDLDWAIRPYGKLDQALVKHNKIEKTNYGISLEKGLEIKNSIKDDNDIKRIEFLGVETNICVLANGIIFQNLFPDAKILVNSKLCASSNEMLHIKAFDIMKEFKMEVI